MSRFSECNFSFLKNSQIQINFKLNEKNHMITYTNVVTVPKTQIKIYTICQPTDLMILKMLLKNADYIKILRCLHYKCVIKKHSMFAFLLENDDGLNSVALHNKSSYI